MATRNSKKVQNGSSLDNIKPMLSERAQLHMKKKQIEDKIKKLDEALRPVLLDYGQAVQYEGFTFEVTQQQGRTSYDYKAMAEDGIDLEPYKKVGAPSTRFVIKEVAEI